MADNEIRVFAPATVANVACGFDQLGFALSHPGDEVVVRFTDRPGLVITHITGADDKLSCNPRENTAGVSALAMLEVLGKNDLGIEMEIHKKMPLGSGLGSSAASSVAGVFAVNELLGRPFEKKGLLPFALEGEFLAHKAYVADNVTSSLLGGILLLKDVEHNLDVQPLPVPSELYAAVVYPQVEILTKTARAILSPTITLKQHIEQSGNLGGFIVGLFNSDFDLIARSLRDVVIEPQRAHLIPHFYIVKEAALHAGALGCSISGSGPSVFALCKGNEIADQVGLAMKQVFQDAGIPCEVFVSTINTEGAIKL